MVIGTNPTEILDVETLQVTPGPAPPPGLSFNSVSFQYNDTFFAYPSSNTNNEIYTFDKETMDWADTGLRLNGGRTFSQATLVRDSMLGCV